MTKAQREKKLHKAVCTYIKAQYPDVIFTSDQSGLKVSIGVAAYLKATRSPSRGLPDLIILHPNRTYCGLMLELKTSRDEVFAKNNQYRKDKHNKEQREVLQRLLARGYKAAYGFGFDHAKQIIDEYMQL